MAANDLAVGDQRGEMAKVGKQHYSVGLFASFPH